MENKNGIIPPKQKVHNRIYIEHNNFIDHFNNILIDVYYNYFEFFLKKSQNNSRDRININKFKDVFNDNSYSFLDLMACFVISCKVQNLSILNFLVSNHETYGQFNTKKYKISNSEQYYISENNVVKNRQLFTLGFLSLLKDYFKICDKNQEEKDDNEKLLTSLFEDIFLDNYKLIDKFKGIKKITLSKHLSAAEIINNICVNVKYNGDIKEINETKEKILNYYEEFLLDETISKKDRVKYFVNWCDSELIFGFNSKEMECEVAYNEINNKNNDIQQQLYQNLTSAFKEVDKINYQIYSASFLEK